MWIYSKRCGYNEKDADMLKKMWIYLSSKPVTKTSQNDLSLSLSASLCLSLPLSVHLCLLEILEISYHTYQLSLYTPVSES